jgi:outer membrane protein assembly factor BamA
MAVRHKSQRIKINIVGVEFRGENFLSEQERSQLVETIQRSNISVSPVEPDTYWANGLRAETIVKALHAQGYFNARTEVTPYLVRTEQDQRSYVVSFEIDTGPQYRIGKLQVVEATVFTPTELREQIHLNPGEAFNDAKIWQGIKSMKLLYGAKGYIDMTAGPSARTDDITGLIDVSVQVVEGTQYRVGTLEILGLGSKAQNLLRAILVPGQIFDSHSFTDFLKENRGPLPIDASDEDITIGRNLDDGTLEIVLDFRRCSGDKIPFPPANRSEALWDKARLVGLSDQWFQLSH